jgi:cysteinyl-tRNA synthetase
VTLRLYDTGARAVREFVPLVPGEVTIYLCGATVQSPPHIGHIRSGLDFDILRRWLEHLRYRVTFCRNVTDIDDKVLTKSAAAGVPWFAWAEANQRAFTEGYDVLGCLPPTVEPRATGHIPEMIQLMRRLVEAGHAYAADGDVYFDVTSYPPYGQLSGQRLDAMQPSADSDSPGKRDPRDFALWKAAKPGEPFWETPWGPGRPGWHLECSAMATKYLGSAFDIHGGGLDLVFPHHENELAQSRAAGDPFAAYWMHNAWVTAGGEKMSKSLGNGLLVSVLVQRVRPVELRFYLTSPHYRSHQEYGEEALHEAVVAYRRLEGFAERASERVGRAEPANTLPAAFVDAMNDDLNVPAALAVVHGTVRRGNEALADGRDDEVTESLAALRGMLGVLGLDPFDPQWARTSGIDDRLRGVVDRLVAVALEQRQAARARRDYAAADAIRAQLSEAGIVVEDTPSGPRWTLKDPEARG